MEKNSLNLIVFAFGILFQEYSFIKSYSLIIKTKVKITFSNIIIFTFIAFLGYLNITYNYTYFKPVLSFILLIILNIIIFKKNIKNIIIYGLGLYIVFSVFDLLYTILTFQFLPTVTLFDNNYIIKTLYTVLVSLTTLFFVHLFNIIIRKKKHIHIIDKKIIINFVLLLIIIISLLFKYVQEMSKSEYLINVFVLLISIILISMNFYQYLKVKKAEEKEIALMEFMTEYEKIIEDNRILKHEMLNNLLVIKSLIKSKPKRLEETLNQIINEYDSKSNSYRSGLYNLPAGIKGLVYYKIYNLKKSNAKIYIYIPKEILKIMNIIENGVYLKIYKILGILIDNAVEACNESNDKIFVLEILEENGVLYFYIENSVKDKVVIEKIHQKGYSTKGSKRGLGLYIVNKLLEKTKRLELKQYINDDGRFVSVLILNK